MDKSNLEVQADFKKAQTKLMLQAQRANLKTLVDYVEDHLLACCEQDTSFAELVLLPKKSILGCMKYIKEQAKQWLTEQADSLSMEEYTDGIGGDIPKTVCYAWAVEYYYAEEKKKTAKPTTTNTVKTTKTTKVEDNGQIDLFAFNNDTVVATSDAVQDGGVEDATESTGDEEMDDAQLLNNANEEDDELEAHIA